MSEAHITPGYFIPRKMMLEWRPMTEPPTEEDAAYLLFSACDGYHVAFNYGGQFCGFDDFAAKHAHEPAHFVAWALLPDEPLHVPQSSAGS